MGDGHARFGPDDGRKRTIHASQGDKDRFPGPQTPSGRTGDVGWKEAGHEQSRPAGHDDGLTFSHRFTFHVSQKDRTMTIPTTDEISRRARIDADLEAALDAWLLERGYAVRPEGLVEQIVEALESRAGGPKPTRLVETVQATPDPRDWNPGAADKGFEERTRDWRT